MKQLSLKHYASFIATAYLALSLTSCAVDENANTTAMSAQESGTNNNTTTGEGRIHKDDKIVVLYCCGVEESAVPDSVSIRRNRTLWFTFVGGDSAEVKMSFPDARDVIEDVDLAKIVPQHDGQLAVGFKMKSDAVLGRKQYEVTFYGCDGESDEPVQRASPVMEVQE